MSLSKVAASRSRVTLPDSTTTLRRMKKHTQKMRSQVTCEFAFNRKGTCEMGGFKERTEEEAQCIHVHHCSLPHSMSEWGVVPRTDLKATATMANMAGKVMMGRRYHGSCPPLGASKKPNT